MDFSYKLCGIILLEVLWCRAEVCDRRPLGITTEPLPPDNQYILDIDGILEDNKYIPKREYTVRLHSRESKSMFIAFSIWLQPDYLENKYNLRKPTPLKAGRLVPSAKYPPDTVYHYKCNDTIIEADITAKNSVSASWSAPDKDNKCVTIFAVVADKPDVWYRAEGPLSRRVCEDRRKADDMQPMENTNCQVCDDARYQLTFEGTWSYNTHWYIYPRQHELARFSDVVGASHSKDYVMFKNNAEASKGLKMLAEQGNTTELEVEILRDLGGSVRTILKASAPAEPNQSTITSFRTTRKHHLVTLATAMLPSPDWFLGVANLELCDARTHAWADNVTFNLYPLDAGTDKGTTFESANEETSPPQPIISLPMTKDIPKEDIKPFARLLFTLVRTYANPECVEHTTAGTTASDDDEENGNGDGDENETKGVEESSPAPENTSMNPQGPQATEAVPEEDCSLTPWSEWSACEGPCEAGEVMGYRWRQRYHLVAGVAVEKYDPNARRGRKKEVSKYCKEKYDVFEQSSCKEECEEEEEETEGQNIE